MGLALSSTVFEAVLHTQPVHPSELQLGIETENILSERSANATSPSIAVNKDSLPVTDDEEVILDGRLLSMKCCTIGLRQGTPC
jgi:hypothetical protein